MVDINNDGIAEKTFMEVIVEIETILINPNGSDEQLELAKDMAEHIHLMLFP